MTKTFAVDPAVTKIVKTLFSRFRPVTTLPRHEENSLRPEEAEVGEGFFFKCDPYTIAIEKGPGSEYTLVFFQETRPLFEYTNSDTSICDRDKIQLLLEELREDLDDLDQKCCRAYYSPLPKHFEPTKKHLGVAKRLREIADQLENSISQAEKEYEQYEGSNEHERYDLKRKMEEIVCFHRSLNAIAWSLTKGTLPECLNPIWKSGGSPSKTLLKKRVAAICYKDFFKSQDDWRDFFANMIKVHIYDRELGENYSKMTQAIDRLLVRAPIEVLLGEDEDELE